MKSRRISAPARRLLAVMWRLGRPVEDTPAMVDLRRRGLVRQTSTTITVTPAYARVREMYEITRRGDFVAVQLINSGRY